MDDRTTPKTPLHGTADLHRRRTAVVAAVVALAVLPSASRVRSMASSYTITDLGTLGGSRSSALGLNDSGQVVGFSKTADDATRAFIYQNGSMQDIGTLGGRDSLAYGISNGGTIVGRAQNKSGEFRAFFTLPNGRLLDVPSLSAVFSGPFSAATGVSPGGLIVGYRLTPGDHMVASSRVFSVSNQMVTDLGTFGGQDAVLGAVNDAGQFVGFFGTDGHADYADHRGFIGRLGGGVAVNLGTLGGRMTTPTAINNAGDAAGFAQLPNGESHAFLYTAGKIIDLGTLAGGRQSFGYGLDDLQQVVGASDSAARTLHAFLYTGGQMVDLNTLIGADSGWVLTEARDINASGFIVGTGIVGGRQHAFLLTPVP